MVSMRTRRTSCNPTLRGLVILLSMGTGCGGEVAEQRPVEDDATSETTTVVDDDAEHLTSCDVELGDCPAVIEIWQDESFRVFLPASVDGMEAAEFSATGTSPQLGLGPVTIGAGELSGRAFIQVTGGAVGAGTLSVTIWYGEERAAERIFELAIEVMTAEG